jgi:hypothetical protein
MAEMERLKADEKTFKAFLTLRAKTKVALEKAYNSVKENKDKGSDDMDHT